MYGSLIRKDIKSELRRPQFVLGVIFFQFCLLFLFFLFQDGDLDSRWWANLFWVNLLIAAMSLVLKNFSQESADEYAYYYQLTDPITIYIAKASYNLMLLLFAAAINFILFQLLFEPKSVNHPRFMVLLFTGVLGMSLSLTLVAFMAGFARNASVMIYILVLPIIIPMFLLLIRSTMDAVDDIYINWLGDLTLVIGIDVLMLAAGIGLFPYLWRR